MGNNDTFFGAGGGAGGGAAASDYLKDAFQDISVPATSNTGFSSTAGRNPFSQAFQNDDAPKYEYKTLWVKDLVLLQDRSKWINNNPTYQVIFNENFPGVYAYVFGNIRLKNFTNGMSVDIRESSGGFGITTTGRRVHWYLNPSVVASQTAYVSVDGSANAVTPSYGDYTGSFEGANKQYPVFHATTQDTRDIHDYRIQSNSTNLNIAGIGVYFENSTAALDCYPGSTYVQMDKKTTSAGSSLTLPTSFSGYIGGNFLAYKTGANAYASAFTERTNISSIAVGTAGTNTVAVETGKGASFPVGTGVVINSHGGSFYVGSVQTVSTDTLTLGPSLFQGISGLIFKSWVAGATWPISATLYQKVGEFEPAQAFAPGNPNTFGANTSVQYYQHPQNLFRVWGTSLVIGSADGFKGVQFLVTGANMNVEGRFVAAEAEWVATPGATSMIHATYMINGAPGAWSQLQGITAAVKQTIFTDSMPGLNMFNISAGATMYGVALNKISFYDLAPSFGQTLGRLANLNIHGSSMVGRNILGITSCALGTHTRVYSDQMYLTGPWTRGVTSAAAGGVLYTGSSNTILATIPYYGKDFAVIGGGAAQVITHNGVAFGSTMNQMLSVATLGFHVVTVTSTTGSLIISAMDYYRPRGEITNLQNFLPRQEIDDSPTFYEQENTPQAPKKGDVWADNPNSSMVWMYLWNRWNRVNISEYSDDPQVFSVFYAGGEN